MQRLNGLTKSWKLMSVKFSSFNVLKRPPNNAVNDKKNNEFRNNFWKEFYHMIIIFIVESFPYLNNFSESKLISRCTLWKHSWHLNRERVLFNPTKSRFDSFSTKLNLFNLNYLRSYFEKIRAENWTRLLKQLCIAKC